MDKVRHYWLLQCALPYGIATFLIALAIFQAHLPSNPWERLLNPVLISPAIASITVVYKVLAKHKKTSDKDDLIFKYYKLGMVLAGLSLVIAVVAQVL